MGEIFTVADIRRSGWREALEERQNYEDERRKRELAKEQEQQQARKVREAETASANWYAAVDTRIRTHFEDWAWAAIDERIQQWMQQWWEHEWDVLKDAIGGALGKKAAQVRDELKRAIEEQRRAFEEKLAQQKERLLALNNLADGAAQLRTEFKHAIEEMCSSFGTEIAALEARLKAAPGKLPVVKTYRPDTVHYAGHLVAHQGATYQALRDTARAPPHVDDWVCIASAGCDGQSVRVRGAFSTTVNYKRFDIVSLDGTAFIARRDNPGIPGISEDGWQFMSRAGTRGPVGEVGPRGRKGERGARGEDGREIVSWHLERATYRAFPVFADGKMGPELNLRPLFEQYCEETGRAVE